jgi:putative nucleotidyltransferase with HDIG domain
VHQRSRSRIRTGLLAAVGFCSVAAGVAAVLTWRMSAGWDQSVTTTFIAFAVFVAAGDLLEVPLQREGVFSLALAPALAFALLEHPHLGETAAVFIAGITVAQMARAATRRPVRLAVVAARLLVVLSAAAAYQMVFAATPKGWFVGDAHVSSVGLAAVLIVVTGLDVVLQSLLAISDEERLYRRMVQDVARETAPLLLSSVSVAALLALSYPSLGGWTLPLFMAPLAATQFSFKQIATIRQNYLQTVGALAKVPEMAGYTEAGHSNRVAVLAVGIAKEMGIGDPELHEIEYAALLHDIGRISLPDPDEASVSTSNLQLALVGAGIIEETGHLPVVARIVRDQHEPYRRRGEDTNRNLSTGARIIKVASAFDDLTVPPGPGRTPREAVERLYLGMAYDYDPQVIQALTRVLERDAQV